MNLSLINQAVGEVDFYYADRAEEDLAVYKRKRNRSFVFLAILLALLIALGCGVWMKYGEDRIPSKYLNAKHACQINQTQYIDGMAIKVERVEGDAHIAKVFLYVWVPNHVSDEGMLGEPLINTDCDIGGYSLAKTSVVNYGEYWGYELTFFSNENLIGREVELKFYGYYLGDELLLGSETQPVTFHFKIGYDSKTKVIPIEKEYGGYYIHHIRVAPDGIIVRTEGLPEEYHRNISRVIITMQDGTQIKDWDYAIQNLTEKCSDTVDDVLINLFGKINPDKIYSIALSFDGETYHTILMQERESSERGNAE